MVKNLILTSQDDLASLNIRENLLKLDTWKKIGVFNSFPVYENDKYYMVHIKGPKIYAENVDKLIEERLKINFDNIIVASKHKSASKMKTLTVHPIGNWGPAEYGGMEKTVVPTNPHLMSEALRLLKKYQLENYNVSFEATHHGPYLTKRTFFIEIGATEEEWRDQKAGEVLANVIMELSEKKYVSLMGFGGGHYVPLLTDIVLKYRVSMGHMVPKYAIPYIDERVIGEACEKSKCSGAYIHRKGLKGEEREKVKEILSSLNLKIYSSKDLEPL